jgi:hypothetical protein
MTIEICGGCYCGTVRYRASQEPKITCNCYCKSCRRTIGAQAVAWVTFPLSAFAWEKGDPVRFASSPGVERTFCGQCGTSLTYTHEDRSDEIDVTTASLDDPEAFPPMKEVFVEDKLSWV